MIERDLGTAERSETHSGPPGVAAEVGEQGGDVVGLRARRRSPGRTRRRPAAARRSAGRPPAGGGPVRRGAGTAGRWPPRCPRRAPPRRGRTRRRPPRPAAYPGAAASAPAGRRRRRPSQAWADASRAARRPAELVTVDPTGGRERVLRRPRPAVDRRREGELVAGRVLEHLGDRSTARTGWAGPRRRPGSPRLLVRSALCASSSTTRHCSSCRLAHCPDPLRRPRQASEPTRLRTECSAPFSAIRLADRNDPFHY